MKIKFGFILFLSLFVSGFLGCNSDKPGKSESMNENSITETVVSSESENEVVEDLLYLIPTPGEVIEQFYDINIPYKPNIVHSVNAMDNYIDLRSQALNLGVYISDLAYSAKFERMGECINYLEAIKTLGIEVGISSKIFESLLYRANNNIDLVDSLVYISDEAFIQMFNFLEVSRKDQVLAIVTTGAYIECLYLVLQTVDSYSEDDPIIQQISELKYPFDNLLSRSSAHSEDANVQKVIRYLTMIKETFDQLAVEETSLVVTKTSDSKLFIAGGEEIVITEEDFQKMKNEIIEIRNQITGI